MKYHRLIVLLMCAAVPFAHGGEVLNASYDTWTLLQQNGATINSDASLSTDPIACLDMGSSGSVTIPSVAMPQGPFSIESRFFLRNYNGTDPNISEILAAFNCNYGGASNSEGVDFEIGGGYNYSLKVQDVYHNVSDWVPPSESEKAARAAVSKAIGKFGLGSGTNVGGHGAWKEVFTDRCIEINKWVHMVATWDGTSMLFYLNGHNATDTWRSVGSGLPAFIASVRTVMIGAETITAWRHMDGKIGYVKMYNEALSSCEVWSKYRQSLGSDRCVDFIKVESPRCGEVISRDTKVKFSVRDSMDNDVTPPGQTFTVHICKEPTFTDAVSGYPTAATECAFGDLVGAGEWNSDGLLYCRISACKTAAALSKTADDNLIAESGVLPAYILASATKNAPYAIPVTHLKKVTSIRQLTNEAVFDIRGRKVGVGAKVASSSLKYGVYFIKASDGTGRKILYVN
jgi:hypothetical protein